MKICEEYHKYFTKFKYFENIERRIIHRYLTTGVLDSSELRHLGADVTDVITELSEITTNLERDSDIKALDRILGVMHVIGLAVTSLQDAYEFNKYIPEDSKILI